MTRLPSSTLQDTFYQKTTLYQELYLFSEIFAKIFPNSFFGNSATILFLESMAVDTNTWVAGQQIATMNFTF